MRLNLRIAAYSLVAATTLPLAPATASDRYGESCTGIEIIQVGSQPPKVAPYRLDFSVDLDRKLYCYADCSEGTTYDVSDAAARPIKLSDFDRPHAVRRLAFDPTLSTISDFQVIDLGPLTTTKMASGVCTPAAFHASWSAPQPNAASR